MLCPALLSRVLPSLTCPAPPALPCAVLPCPMLPFSALPCLVWPYPVLPDLPCPALPCASLPCPTLLPLPCPVLLALVLPSLTCALPSHPCPVLSCPASRRPLWPCPALCCLVLSYAASPPSSVQRCPPLPCPVYATLLTLQDHACLSCYYLARCIGCKLSALDRTYCMMPSTLNVSVNTSMASILEWHQRRQHWNGHKYQSVIRARMASSFVDGDVHASILSVILTLPTKKPLAVPLGKAADSNVPAMPRMM